MKDNTDNNMKSSFFTEEEPFCDPVIYSKILHV